LETFLADHILLHLRTIFITSHSAFYTREAIERILKTTVENIRAFAGGEPQNVVV
jgi:D-lactate dehydrogenase